MLFFQNVYERSIPISADAHTFDGIFNPLNFYLEAFYGISFFTVLIIHVLHHFVKLS